MKRYHLRDIPDRTYALLQDRANASHVSLNKYIVTVLHQHAMSPELREQESRFMEILRINTEALKTNNLLQKRIIQLMGEEVDD